MAITLNVWAFLEELTRMAHLLICTITLLIYSNWIDSISSSDCNGSNSQKWQWNGDLLTSVNPVDGSQWCLDAGVNSQCKYIYFRFMFILAYTLTGANGVRMKIWQCFSGLPQQTWTPDTSSGTIKLTTANFCLDLTNGITTNQNILQIWTCGGGNTNQIWTVTSA